MIDGIRRRFVQSADSETWDADQELEPEVEDTPELEEKPETDTAVFMAATQANAHFVPNNSESADYYKTIIKTAIENGGKYGDHQISIPWLRMILAGLESRHIEPEMMWYGVEPEIPTEAPLPEMPSYDRLFPYDADVPAGSDLR